MSIPVTAPFTALQVEAWSPSDWQERLPPELGYVIERIGSGAVKAPVYANAAARNLVITSPAAGDLAYLTDVGSATPALQIYNGSTWLDLAAGPAPVATTVEIPVYANAAARNAAVTVPAAGDLVYLTDAGAAAPAVQVYNGATWNAVWPSSGGGSPPGGYVAQVFVIVSPAGDSSNAVHAAYGGDQPEAFPGPITNPDVPRVLSVSYGGSWDGGDVTVTGTDQYDVAVNETFAFAPAATVDGVKVFKTVTGITHSVVGVDPDTASVGQTNYLGITIADRTSNAAGNFDVSQGLVYIGFRGTMVSSFTVDAAEGHVLPSQIPNGINNMVVTLNVTVI